AAVQVGGAHLAARHRGSQLGRGRVRLLPDRAQPEAGRRRPLACCDLAPDPRALVASRDAPDEQAEQRHDEGEREPLGEPEDHRGGASVAISASATTRSGFPDTWLALRRRAYASCSLSPSRSISRPLARSIALRAASASTSESTSCRSSTSCAWRARAVSIAGSRSVSRN